MKRFICITFIIALNIKTPAYAVEFNNKFAGLSVGILESSNSNYEHDTIFVRAHFDSESWDVGGWDFHWTIEPNINWYEHDLNDPLYVKDDEPNYLERRKRFTSGVNFLFAGVETAIVAKKKLSEQGKLEFSAGLGIGYLEDETERQAKGFTFSETGRAGYSFNSSIGEFFVGYTIMHVSNAGLKNPNGGYDLSGVSIRYKKNLKPLP